MPSMIARMGAYSSNLGRRPASELGPLLVRETGSLDSAAEPAEGAISAAARCSP
jgi:hypothetical protein